MKTKLKRRLRPALLTLGGALAGLAYYHLGGCASGCPITATAAGTMAYTGLAGWILSGAFGKAGEDRCSM